jgi:hypothetical protein
MRIKLLWALLFPVLILPQIVNAFENTNTFEKNNSQYKVLVFFSKYCPCSRSHVDHLNSLNTKYKNLSFFGVITDVFDESSKKEIEDYYNSKNFNFPIIEDGQQLLVKQYSALKTPHTVLLKRQANHKYKVLYQGGVSDNRDFSNSNKKFLSENIAALMQGKPLIYQEGKSLGCYIRRF